MIYFTFNYFFSFFYLYDELNAILIKYSEPIVDVNSTFILRAEGFELGPQNNLISYLVKYLDENNKTLPEISKVVISNNGGNQILTKDICFVLNILFPIKTKEFVFFSK